MIFFRSPHPDQPRLPRPDHIAFSEERIQDATYVLHTILGHGEDDWRDCLALTCTGAKDYMRRVLGRNP